MKTVRQLRSTCTVRVIWREMRCAYLNRRTEIPTQGANQNRRGLTVLAKPLILLVPRDRILIASGDRMRLRRTSGRHGDYQSASGFTRESMSSKRVRPPRLSPFSSGTPPPATSMDVWTRAWSPDVSAYHRHHSPL